MESNGGKAGERTDELFIQDIGPLSLLLIAVSVIHKLALPSSTRRVLLLISDMYQHWKRAYLSRTLHFTPQKLPVQIPLSGTSSVLHPSQRKESLS